MLIEMMLKVCALIYRIWMGGMAWRSGHHTGVGETVKLILRMAYINQKISDWPSSLIAL